MPHYRIFDPKEIVARVPDRGQFHQGLFGVPSFVRIDHDQPIPLASICEAGGAGQIVFKIRMSDLILKAV
jgi:hypothetical protein